MQEPGSPSGSWESPPTPGKRTRRKRTVFSAQQLCVLENFFEEKRYRTHGERQTLAARLDLQEHQVQVWLKNRRAKDRRLQRLRGQQGPGDPAAPQEQGVCALQPAGPVIQGDSVLPASPVLPATPVFPAGPVPSAMPVPPAGPVHPAAALHHQGPGFCSLSPHSPGQVFPAADPSASSYSQASRDPEPGIQGISSAALAPAPDPAPVPDPDRDQDPEPAPVPDPDLFPDRDPDPDPGPVSDPDPDPDPDPSKAIVSPQVPDAGNFSPDPDFTELLSPYSPLEESPSSPRPWYDFVGDSEVDLFQLLDLQGSPSPPSPADATAPEGTRVCAHAGARSTYQCVWPGSCSCAESAHL